jgi:hypothetical protein
MLPNIRGHDPASAAGEGGFRRDFSFVFKSLEINRLQAARERFPEQKVHPGVLSLSA